MNGGELRVFDGVESTMADVVFVVEQGPCIKNIDLVEALAKLDNAMSSQGLDTRFSVVAFNGKQFGTPHTRTSNGKIWSNRQNIEKILRR